MRRPPVRPVRGKHLVRRGRVRRTRPDRLRPRHRAAQLRRRSSPPRAALDGYRATVLLTHLHWDHIQGLPFFAPLAAGGGTVTVVRSAPGGGPARRTVFRQRDEPAVLPDHARGAARRRRLRGGRPTTTSRSTAPRCGRGGCATPTPPSGSGSRWRACRSRTSPTTGPARCPTTPTTTSRDDVLELCDGVDLLIHDAQHTTDEYEIKRTWGHCTIEYAIHVAKEAGARELALFHHCPSHGDDRLDDHPARRPRAVGTDRTAPRCSPRPTACATSSGRADREPGSVRCPTRLARPRRQAVPLRARALRHRRHDHHRDGRRRTGRHGRQLVHVAVARPAARSCSASRTRRRTWPRIEQARQVRGEHPRRGPRGAVATCSPRRAPTASARRRGACGVSGAPVLEEAIAYLDCEFEAEYPGGDHKIIVGRVLDLDMREGVASAPVLQGRVRAHARGVT